MRDHFRGCRLLTKDEELAAWERKDYDLLIQSQIPLVLHIAGGICYYRKFRDKEDCVSAGLVALTRCVQQKFDASKGFRLTTYATMPIRTAVNYHIDKAKRVAGRNWTNELSLHQLADETDPAIVCEEREEQRVMLQRLPKAIARLPENRRIAVQSMLAGETCAAAGERIGLCRAAVSINRIRGISQLRHLMG